MINFRVYVVDRLMFSIYIGIVLGIYMMFLERRDCLQLWVFFKWNLYYLGIQIDNVFNMVFQQVGKYWIFNLVWIINFIIVFGEVVYG